MKSSKAKKIKVTPSSGNIFKDFGLENHEELQEMYDKLIECLDEFIKVACSLSDDEYDDMVIAAAMAYGSMYWKKEYCGRKDGKTRKQGS